MVRDDRGRRGLTDVTPCAGRPELGSANILLVVTAHHREPRNRRERRHIGRLSWWISENPAVRTQNRAMEPDLARLAAVGGRAGDGPMIAAGPHRARSLSNGSGSCIRQRCRRHDRRTIHMFARLLILFYAVASYSVFLASSLYAVGFVGNYLVPKSIDIGGSANFGEAIVIDLLLLGPFAIQHSAMARPAFKRWWNRIFPVACQRSTYVLLSSLILLLLFWQWRPIPMAVWRIEGLAAWLLVGVYWLGWSIVFASTFMIDHFDLSGLRQAFFALRGAEMPGQSFRTPLLYKIVRHPLMLGFLLAFWATPEI